MTEALLKGERRARIVLASLCGSLIVITLAVDLPSLTGGHFFNDGATYYTMALSIAEDFDLRFDAGDLARVRREYPGGPDGVFLKRPGNTVLLDSSRGYPFPRRVGSLEKDRPIFFGKPFVYPLLAAPFVRILGSRGLLFVNALCLSLALCLAYAELRRRASPGRALLGSLVFIFATVAPLYLFWPTPELFHLAVSIAGLAAWRANRPLLAAGLFGLGAYAKPPLILLALPLCLDPFASGFRPGLRESVRRGAVLVLTTFLLFFANRVVTGEWNYQGGERKTFYGHFPMESPKVTFGNSGFWMTAEHIGPTLEGEDNPGRGAIVRARAEVREAFLWNLGYFWVGRFSGVVPYFFPAALAIMLFLAFGPREVSGWLALLALVLSYLFWIVWSPDNWYGGGGTLGNRYFLGIVPLAILLIPRGREILFGILGGLIGGAFVGPLFLSPIENAVRPGLHATREPFLKLPAELTMLNDLSVFTDPWRKKVPFGDTKGDPHRGWPADPKSYWLYFLDDQTFFKETAFGAEGFWLRGGGSAEIVLRALEPVSLMKVKIHGGPGGDRVSLRVGPHKATILMGEGDIGSISVEPGRPYVFYDSFVYTLHLRSEVFSHPREDDPDGRDRGGFVQIGLDVKKRPR